MEIDLQLGRMEGIMHLDITVEQTNESKDYLTQVMSETEITREFAEMRSRASSAILRLMESNKQYQNVGVA